MKSLSKHFLKVTRLGFVLCTLLVLNACTAIHYDNVGLDKKGHTVISAIDMGDNQKIENLYQAIMSLGPNIMESEARFVAREAVLYPKILARL
jgi:hypothetical protein